MEIFRNHKNTTHMAFWCPQIKWSGVYCFWPVCLSVILSVILSQNFNIGHNFCNIEDSNLIFGMHVYLMELHILSGERSRSSFKVKGQIYGFKAASRGHCDSKTQLLFYKAMESLFQNLLFPGQACVHPVAVPIPWSTGFTRSSQTHCGETSVEDCHSLAPPSPGHQGKATQKTLTVAKGMLFGNL
jgi:hypothetical protein